MGREDAGLGSALGIAVSTGEDLAIGNHGTGALQGGIDPEIEYLGFPGHLAGKSIHGENIVIGAGRDDQVSVDGVVSSTSGIPNNGGQFLRHLPAVLPDRVSGGGIPGPDDILRIRHIHGAVVYQRRTLLGALDHFLGPDQGEPGDILAIHLIERTVTPAIQGPAPHQPVGRIGIPQDGVSDRDERGRVLGFRV